jgi:hypothetical protein
MLNETDNNPNDDQSISTNAISQRKIKIKKAILEIYEED